MTHLVFRPHHLLACLLAASTVLAVPAARAADIETQTAEVSTHGLDLTKPQGEAMLRHRVALAAQRVCGEAERGDFASARNVLDCRDAAMLSAEAKIRTVIARAHERAAYAAGTNHNDQVVR